MNYEQQRALMEGERNGAADDYFAARPQTDNEDNRDLFAAGFVRGYGTAVCKNETRDGVLVEMLRRWLLFASDVQPGCAAGAEELQILRARTERLLPPNA